LLQGSDDNGLMAKVVRVKRAPEDGDFHLRFFNLGFAKMSHFTRIIPKGTTWL